MVTKTTKTRAKKSKAEPAAEQAAETPPAAAAGGPASSDSLSEAKDLSLQLAAFGFEVPEPVIAQWSGETFKQIARVVLRWQEEQEASLQGTPFPDDERTGVPPLLAAMEFALSPEVAAAAIERARQMKAANLTSNPFPPESGIAKVWQDAFSAADAPAAAPAETSEASNTEAETTAAAPAEPVQAAAQPADVSPPAEPAPPAKTNAELAAELNAKRADEARAERERQQQLAIEAAQHDMEEAVTHQEELTEQIVDLKAEMKELKSAYDNAVVRGQKAAKALRRARAGVFERTLPFRESSRDESLDVPDQNIGGKQTAPTAAPAAAAPAAPLVDEGASIGLEYLTKGQLQEYIPGTPEDRGLSAKQIEKLKEAIGGDTIGKLEEFQRNKGEWWTTSIDGFAKATITKLQDAQEIIRRKYPIPSADDRPAAAAEQPAEQAPETPAEPEQLPMDCEEARQTLQTIIKMCDEVEAGTVNLDGVRFVRSVKTQAGDMFEGIKDLDFEQVTTDQSRAIRNWFTGVEAWHEKLGTDFGDGLEDETGLGGGDPGDDSDDELEPTEDAGAELENDDEFDHAEFEDDEDDDEEFDPEDDADAE